MNTHQRTQHDMVIHPRELLTAERKWIGRVNDALASHLGLVFGSVWVVWVFFVWPLIAQFMSTVVQVKTSYYAQSWVQLFALPLFVYIGNKLQKSSDAQSDVQHLALTHIANVGDDVKTLLEQNNTITAEVHALVSAQTAVTPTITVPTSVASGAGMTSTVTLNAPPTAANRPSRIPKQRTTTTAPDAVE